MRSYFEWMPVSKLSHPEVTLPPLAASLPLNYILANAYKGFQGLAASSARQLLSQLSSNTFALGHIHQLLAKHLAGHQVTSWIDGLNDMLVLPK